ncbi:MAG: hypothetical protein GXP06_11090 [Alphaproteobacteria bacterium]|nr:hypothetical protein [Alphaproteobacteria bacterium]
MTENATKMEEAAANYSLGALSGEEHARVEAEIASNPAMAQLVMEWQDRFAPLFDSTEEVTPPAHVLERLDAALDRQAASGSRNSVTIRDNEGSWIAIAPGIRKKILYLDEAVRKEAYLLDFDAGASLPEHNHHATEDCLVISGDFRIGDLQLKAGDFHAAFAASQHLTCRSEHGCRLFIKAAA